MAMDIYSQVASKGQGCRTLRLYAACIPHKLHSHFGHLHSKMQTQKSNHPKGENGNYTVAPSTARTAVDIYTHRWLARGRVA